MDEAGQDEYIDTHSMKVVVPVEYNGFNIKIPVRRKNKRSTLVHCICLDGTYLKPLIIIPRKTVDNIILKRATCNNVILKFQNKGFSTTELTKIWLTEIFFPEIEKRWNEEHQRSGFNGNAVLIIDGCSTHGAALRQFNLAEKHIEVIYLVPHSSHLTQPLDLALFAIQKLNTYKKKLTLKLSDQADKIRSILKGLQQASTTENIISAFESAGIFHYYDQSNQINFNNYMPTTLISKENSRYYKNDGGIISMNNSRLKL